MSICGLLANLKRLNTKERIGRWNSNIDRTCVLCSNLHEDRDHIFINYVYSRQILEGIMHKLQINLGTSFDINSTLDTLCNKQNNNSLFNHIINTTFTSMIQHIWCERNSRIFKGIEKCLLKSETHVYLKIAKF